mmetsp:Transcript_25573/g.55387  ORF Transcript_25573/g.55387 Transcript_25573/m.55387 type:complete len:370 (+) Transcript_25573:607-1716(+)
MADMEEGGIDGHAASGGVLHDAVLHSAGVGKEVEGEGLGVGVDVVDGEVHVGDGDNEEDGSKGLFRHGGRLERHLKNCRLDVPFLEFVVSAVDDAASVRLENAHQALHLPIANHTTNVTVHIRLWPVHGGGVFPTQLEEVPNNLLVTENIVRGDALLSSVEHAAPHSALRRQLEIGALVHEDRVLAAKLQSAWREVPSSLFHDDLSDAGRAREEDMVKFVLQKSASGVTITFNIGANNGDNGGIQILRNELCHQTCRVRRNIARLENHTVASSNSSSQGHHAEHHGVIPRANHEDKAEGFLVDFVHGWKSEEVETHALRPDVAVQVLDQVVDLMDGQELIVVQDFELGSAEILRNGLQDGVFVFNKQPL